ncbi:MAG: hypothetical protein HZA48_12060 [Planctomycetes bacterium]|nr:hypothetical protein [Planctomycetota bacterium]
MRIQDLKNELLTNKWFFLLIFLSAGQVVFNFIMAFIFVKANPSAKIYFLTFHLTPQIVCLVGLVSYRYWAWLGCIAVSGYNAVDFARALLIIGARTEANAVFGIITISVNIVMLVILIIKREYFIA